MKSSILIVNAINIPENTPGRISGNTTLKKALKGDAPRSMAASYAEGLSCFIRGKTLSITYGILNVICASSIVVKPNLILKNMKRSIKEIPVTISALSMGILVMPIINVLVLFLRPVIAIAAIVPINVAIIDERRASINVVIKASIMEESDKSLAYHLKVKPPHLDLDFDALNDKTISTAMGAYKNMKMREM